MDSEIPQVPFVFPPDGFTGTCCWCLLNRPESHRQTAVLLPPHRFPTVGRSWRRGGAQPCLHCAAAAPDRKEGSSCTSFTVHSLFFSWSTVRKQANPLIPLPPIH